jgi:hypothetical protein
MVSTKKKAAKKPQKPQKALTIDFAGICTFVWNKKAGTAEMRLVDLESAGFQRHYAALGIAVNERTPKALKGPEADAAMSMPDSNTDLGLWNLIGCDVQVVGASGKLTVDDSKADVTKKPVKSAESIRWLADIGYLAGSTDPNALCPTAATFALSAGHVTANATVGNRRVSFSDASGPVGPTRFCVPRLRVVIPFEEELALVLDRRRILRFSDSMQAVVSNTCVCAVGLEGMPDHFYAHYDVVDARRRPKVTAAQAAPRGGAFAVAAPQLASFPEFCYMGFVEI